MFGSAAIALALYLPLAIVWGVDFGRNSVLIAIGGILVRGENKPAPSKKRRRPIRDDESRSSKYRRTRRSSRRESAEDDDE